MSDKYNNAFRNTDQTTKENVDISIHTGKLSSFDTMKKTSCNHQQLLHYLSVSNPEKSLKKPACASSWDSSALFEKYANIGSNAATNNSLWQSVVNHQFVASSRGVDNKFGTASILTNSSMSGTQSVDLPLQSSINNGGSSAAASKAILALQDKVKTLERENGFLREIVATNEQKNWAIEEVKTEMEHLQHQHQLEMQEWYKREQELQSKLQALRQDHNKMTAYSDACNLRLRELEKSSESCRLEQTSSQSCRNNDLQIDPGNYQELVAKIEEYECIINDLEQQRADSLSEVEQMRHQIEAFSESLHNSRPISNPSQKSLNSELSEANDRIKKLSKETKRLKDQLFKQKKDFEAKLSSAKRRHKLDWEGYKQECTIKEREIERLRKEIDRLKRKQTKTDIDQSKLQRQTREVTHYAGKKSTSKALGYSERNHKDVWSCDDEQPVKISKHRRSKARASSSCRRSKSRDKASDSWLSRNKHLINSKSKRSARSKSRLNSSGLPLYRNNSITKTEEKDGKKQVIVNLEWPVKWKPEDSNVGEQNLSRSISLENPIKRSPYPNEALLSSQSSEQFNFSGLNVSKWIPRDNQMHADELKTSKNLMDKESETYKSFLKMIKQRAETQSDEIKIKY